MIKLYNFDELKPEEILNRDIRAEKNVEDVVDGIVADVRARGDEALKDYALKFDGAKIENLQVTQAEIDEAFAGMDPYFLETLRQAAANIENFHRQQVHKNFVVNDKPGIVLGQKYTPIEKAGVYVPGGTAAYPSTVLMDVIPAKVAGVSEIVMTTPAGKDGRVNPVILAAAATAGVTRIFKTGGAQAVAALAYGTQTIPAVDKIVGPGNIYVATAKRKVFGKVGIDMIAGPSEILVLADGGCNPAWVAADLLSQAEHDKLASPVLVTDSPELAKAVQAELEVQIPQPVSYVKESFFHLDGAFQAVVRLITQSGSGKQQANQQIDEETNLVHNCMEKYSAFFSTTGIKNKCSIVVHREGYCPSQGD